MNLYRLGNTLVSEEVIKQISYIDHLNYQNRYIIQLHLTNGKTILLADNLDFSSVQIVVNQIQQEIRLCTVGLNSQFLDFQNFKLKNSEENKNVEIANEGEIKQNQVQNSEIQENDQFIEIFKNLLDSIKLEKKEFFEFFEQLTSYLREQDKEKQHQCYLMIIKQLLELHISRDNNYFLFLRRNVPDFLDCSFFQQICSEYDTFICHRVVK